MANYFDSFSHLDELLTQSRCFWQFMPFSQLDYQWRETYPELCEWLENLSEAQLAEYQNNAELLAHTLKKWIPQSVELFNATSLAFLPQKETVLPRGSDTGIPGRKWQQITAFTSALPKLGLPWLEWCAGKGHLGRVLALSHQQSVVSLEWQDQLCIDGEAMAQHLNLPITFVQADAFAKESQQHIKTEQHAVALHACGDLHTSLLQHCAAKQAAAVSISPCCYHLIRSDFYQMLSEYGKKTQLQLSKHDLRLPLQETVTAGQRVQALRETEVSFRLGFDALQRHVRDVDEYLSVPNTQKALFNQGFSAFCHWAAEKKSINLAGLDIDYDYWLAEGKRRFQISERMELVRQLFRRPLEMWLVLDRACFMVEQGYQVEIGLFCEKLMTPRNILINACISK
ncbi:TPA: methyltransferase [Photobacterium damselae]